MILQGIVAAVLFCFGQAGAVDGGWNQPEREAIREALGCILLDPRDLLFEKKAAPSAPRLTIADALLDDPLRGVEVALGAADDAAAGLPQAILLAGRFLEVGEIPLVPEPEVPPGPAGPSPLPPELLAALEAAARDLSAASDTLGRALLPLGEADAAWARERAWTLPLEPDNPEMQQSSGAAVGESDLRRLYSLGAKVDSAGLLASTRAVWEVADRLGEVAAGIERFEGGAGEPLEGVTGDFLYNRETPAGEILVGGLGPNTYSRKALLILDLGGDDRYMDGAGGGDVRRGQAISIIIDRSGDDLYRSGASVSQGAGYFGIGCLLDLSGDDAYRGTNLAQGAGLFGAGILEDREGDDTYEGDTACQAAGLLGVGILSDGTGRDRYGAALFSQGFAGVLGVGLLIDREGNDLYHAGGRYLHRPLFADRYRSLSQGFSIGDRYAEAGGGVALLYDGGGNDAYVADIYGQGSSYWYSVGLLVDRSGHDTYTLGQYGQGGGIHLSTGVLVDLAGDDLYHCTHGVGQGGGHDYAVGVLLDRGGNDYYSGAGLTQGAGNANGVGLLLDAGGNDAYAGTKGGIQGHGNPARSFSSVGVLVDLGGKDRYSAGGKDGSVWKGGDRGVGLDRADPEGGE